MLASQGLLLRTGSVEGLAFHDHGDFEMKGLADPVRVSRICPVDLDPDALAARFALNGRSSPATTEVPRALDTATPIVGREREIHRLRWAWRRARRSEGAAMLLLGPPGIGKTRLLAELATSAAHDGASITYATSRDPQDPEVLDRAIDPTSSSLVLLDDLEAWTEPLDVLTALRSRITGTRALLVAAMDDSSLPAELDALVRSADGAVVRPAPLDLDDIREIAGLYIGASADALPASLLESTGGVPRRIHRNVSEWALAEANRRLGAAASRAAAGRSDLRSVESELAGNVVDLQISETGPDCTRRWMAGRPPRRPSHRSKDSHRSTSGTRISSSVASASSPSSWRGSPAPRCSASLARRGAGSPQPSVPD